MVGQVVITWSVHHWLARVVEEEEEEGPHCASQAFGWERAVLGGGGSLYLRKLPPPISLLYLLVRLSACSVSLDSTPNSPLRW